MNESLKVVSDYQAFLQTRKYAERTLSAYAHWIKQLVGYYPNRALEQLSQAEINEFFDQLETHRKLSSSSRRQAISALQIFFKSFLVNRSDLSFESYSTQFKERAVVAVPTQVELLGIFSEIKNSQHKLALELIYGMGLELGEVVDISVRDINFSKRRIKIKLLRKRGLYRSAIVPMALVEPLKGLVKNRKKTGFVFESRSDQKLPAKSLQRAFKNALHAAGHNKSYSVRSLRYAYVRHMELLGVPVKSVLEGLEINTDTSLAFYSSIGSSGVSITFSPFDRSVPQSKVGSEKTLIVYVSEVRIRQLLNISSSQFDYSRLVELLREINSSNSTGSYFAIAILIRVVLDHIPPLFGQSSFKQVANNYSGGKSFKRAMTSLESALRHIADKHLHTTIRKKESLPTFEQVDFRGQLDLLLEEVVRIAA